MSSVKLNQECKRFEIGGLACQWSTVVPPFSWNWNWIGQVDKRLYVKCKELEDGEETLRQRFRKKERLV
jgi:hypothetical protein